MNGTVHTEKQHILKLQGKDYNLRIYKNNGVWGWGYIQKSVMMTSNSVFEALF